MNPDIQYFLLILMRITAFVWISPGFSNSQIPTLPKLALSTGIGISVFAVMPSPTLALDLGTFVIVMIKEIILGIAIGYITQLFFSAVEMAGNFVDFQVGFSMSMAYDPALGVNASYYGQLYYWIALIIFFLSDVHHHVIRTLFQSFEYIPISQTEFYSSIIEGIVQIFVYVFELALNLAIPLIFVALVSEIILGLLSRTVPQINVLILGIPLKILLSLIFMFLFLPVLVENIADLFPEMLKMLEEFITALSQ